MRAQSKIAKRVCAVAHAVSGVSEDTLLCLVFTSPVAKHSAKITGVVPRGIRREC